MKNLQTLLNNKGYNLVVDGVIGPKSLTAVQNFILKEISKRNWVAPITDLVWLRLDQTLTDTFDDIVVRFNKGAVDMVCPASTTAGQYYYIHNIITYGGIKGCAITVEQQVLKSHQFITNATWGLLWTKAPYFQQVRDVCIYRDGNGDSIINRDIKTCGQYGINLHRGWSGARIWNASAGCNICPDQYWYNLILPFKNGELYSYTLIEV